MLVDTVIFRAAMTKNETTAADAGGSLSAAGLALWLAAYAGALLATLRGVALLA